MALQQQQQQHMFFTNFIAVTKMNIKLEQTNKYFAKFKFTL